MTKTLSKLKWLYDIKCKYLKRRLRHLFTKIIRNNTSTKYLYLISPKFGRAFTVYYIQSMEKLTHIGRIDDFRIFYNHSIHPELRRMEKKRNRLLILIGVSAFFGIGLAIIAQLLNIFSLSLIIILILVLYITFLTYRVNTFVKTFKPRIMNLILDFIDDGINYGALSYDAEGGIGRGEFMKSNLFFPNRMIFEEEDYIKGTIGSVDFQLCEMRVLQQSKVRNSAEWIFDGVFMKAKLHFKLNGNLYILPKSEKPYLSKTLKNILGSGNVKVNNLIRNKEFTSIFETFASKKTNPMQFLTEGLQNSIIEYTNSFDKLFYLSFNNGTIYLAISEEKDILEPNLFKSNLKFNLVKEFYEDVFILLRIVEELDLHH